MLELEKSNENNNNKIKYIIILINNKENKFFIQDLKNHDVVSKKIT